MSDFIVRFHGIELSKEHASRVQAAIQKTVLAEVSSVSSVGTPDPDGTGDSGGSVLFLSNHIWRGIIYLPAAVLAENPGIIETPLRVTQAEIAQE
jgi:hypothetical protein